ncbi:hypothetical protein [Staphylococcus schweitzeri]|uniref:hypothetical protein n=1 Tax=Staphylococcus schweitzeri TaxID=1654388 RepID=UPI00050766CD|nr:hypothetical protein [Staphylococcus schweitzeri]CDR61306.1 hypothetical protein ERS140239_01127 [Staphylococcus schweitzeri]
MQKSKLDVKTILNIVLIIILAIISFVLVVGYMISSVDSKHSITGYSIAISFLGIFSTFGGAYLGAKISGDNATKLLEKEYEKKSIKDREKIKIRLRMSMDFIVKINDRIVNNYSTKRIASRLYKEKEFLVDEKYNIKMYRAENKDYFKNKYCEYDNCVVNEIKLPKRSYEELTEYISIIDGIIYSNEMIELNAKEQKQLFIFKQVLKNIFILIEQGDSGEYVINVFKNSREKALIEYLVQLNILLIDIQEWCMESIRK